MTRPMRRQAETLAQKILRRARRLLPPPAFRELQERFRARSGMEIGGPSAVFRRWNLWPLYPIVGTLDNYNFATHTIWSREARTASRLKVLAGRQPPGREFIGEASAMTEIESSAYDFLLASHVLEHMANPLKALHTWQRVLKPGGTIVLVVPHRDGTFDHRRPITSIEHIVSDFARDVTEHDDTHLAEILSMHDLSRDPGAGSRDAFVARARSNIEHRSLHHHVFDTDLVLKLVDKAGLRIVYVDLELPFHICVACSSRSASALAEADDGTAWNSGYWSQGAVWRRRGLFPSDRRPAET